MNSTPKNSTVAAKVLSTRRIARFENHPAMPALLKELPSRAVASLFKEIGIVDSTALMAMMPTRALLLAFDESIWKSPRPGLPETIGVRDLIDWLIAWSEIGEEFLIEKLAAMNEDYLTSLLARLIKVESASRYAVYGEDREVMIKFCEDDRERMAPYLMEPAVDEDRDVVADTVRALWITDPQKLLRVFDRLTDLPNSDDSTRGSMPTLHDIEFERESFRQAHGFVTADGARAFFAFAERLTVPEIIALDRYDAETLRYFNTIERASQSTTTASGPVVDEDLDEESDSTPSVSQEPVAEQSNTAGLRELLEDLQFLPKPSSVPLLHDARHSKEKALTSELRRLAGEYIESFHARARELAYLANILRCVPSSDDESLTDEDAKAAAFAICNLGFELMDSVAKRKLEDEPGLVRLFLLGWNALSGLRGRVAGAFAGALSRSSDLAPWLLGEATAGLSDLRRAVDGKRFEEAREAALFLSIVFDSSVCHAIAPLLHSIPRFSTSLDSDGDAQRARWIETKADLHVLDRLLDTVQLKLRTATQE